MWSGYLNAWTWNCWKPVWTRTWTWQWPKKKNQIRLASMLLEYLKWQPDSSTRVREKGCFKCDINRGTPYTGCGGTSRTIFCWLWFACFHHCCLGDLPVLQDSLLPRQNGAGRQSNISIRNKRNLSSWRAAAPCSYPFLPSSRIVLKKAKIVEV